MDFQSVFPPHHQGAGPGEEPETEVGADDRPQTAAQHVRAIDARNRRGVFRGIRNGPEPELREHAGSPQDETGGGVGQRETREKQGGGERET